MADGDAAPAEEDPGQGSSPAASADLTDLAAALRDEIMQDVEAMLSQKAESLWKRGQAEISKMKEDRNEVASSLAGLQQRQDALITEQKAMHSALLDITTKMEFVAMEMREALRVAGKNGGSSGLLLPESSSPVLPTVGAASQLLAEIEHGLAMQGLCTPPRIAPQTAASPSGSCIAPPLPGSPAVLLSLASALPSATAPSTSTAPAPQQCTTRLQIAECLDIGGTSPVSKGGASPMSTTASSSALAGGINGGSSTSGSPLKFEVDADIIQEGLSPQASGAILRADAPEFVPGGGYVVSDDGSSSSYS